MAFLAYRRDTIFKRSGSNILAQPSASIFVCKAGGVASSSSSANVITMVAGHGFIAGDKILINPGASQIYSGSSTVQSYDRTTITLNVASTFAVSSGDLIFNLGSDTSTSTTPNYNSGKAIYSDRAGSTAISSFTVSTNSDGEYSYSHYGGSAWEIVLVSGSVVDTFIEADRSLILREPTPYATDFDTAAEITSSRVPLQIYGASTTTPMLTFTPWAPTDTYPILLRIGTRANTTGDSRMLGYFSETINEPGATESQSIACVNVYTGSGTSTQMAVMAESFSLPGSGKSQLSVVGVQGLAGHYDEAGGTSSVLKGGFFSAFTGTGNQYTGTIGTYFGCHGRAHVRAPNVTSTNAVGVYGEVLQSNSATATHVWAGRFDMPEFGTNRHAITCYTNVADAAATIAFYNGTNYKTIKWDNANGRFQLSHALLLDSTLAVTGATTLTGALTATTSISSDGPVATTTTNNGFVVGANTDTNIAMIRANTIYTEPQMSWAHSATESQKQFTFNYPLRATELRASSDVGGIGSSTSLTNVKNTSVSTGAGSILMCGATNRSSTGFIKIYIDTTAYYIPVFTTITG